ncbi:MAG TPA: ATP-dependent metallopeptidase FtsH/Yme1/Tma family protein [Bacillota bacterium]|nr:ATP-dependent metallopeptidase FtsH/Yme1/Tma family protein [Bacillota bacterium]
MRNKKNTYIIIVVVALIVIIGVATAIRHKAPEPQVITYNTFLTAIEEGRVESVLLNDSDILKGKYKDGTSFTTDNPRRDGFKEDLLMHDVAVDESGAQMQLGQIGGLVFTLGIFGVVLFIFKKKEKQTQGKFIKTALVNPEDDIKTSFDSIAGNEEAKESMQEMVDFILHPERYVKYGARLPRGVILYGSPGTGKTLMAKAVSGEAGVPYFAVSGSDFVQVYVGVGAGRIRDLFKKARECGKCVIFIDEIDALGKKRDAGPEGGSNDERDQTLNALLAEMSGFNDNEGIVVIAATNRLDTLDEALLRPGRFDRHIEIELPDIRSRRRILELHSRNKPLDKSVDLEQVAYQTVYFSGAKLEGLLNEAAIIAAKRNDGSIDMNDIDKAFYTVIAGAEKKDRSSISDSDRKVTAYHEAGHALVTRLTAPENRVTKVTIIPSTKGAGGFSMNIPPDRMYHKKVDMENAIRIALGGRAAEELVFGAENITTGGSNDIEKATGILLDMVRRFGMREKSGLLNYDVLYQNGLGQGHANMTEDLKCTMDQLYLEVKHLVSDNINILKAIAENLLVRETLDEKDLELIMETY